MSSTPATCPLLNPAIAAAAAAAAAPAVAATASPAPCSCSAARTPVAAPPAAAPAPGAPAAASPCAAPAEVLLKPCSRHGLLPADRFYKDDWVRNRHRCKRCVADRVAARRQRQPLRTLWLRFVQRAKVRFGADTANQWTWREHGRPLLLRLVANLPAGGASRDEVDLGPELLRRYLLTWRDDDAETLQDLEQLELRPKRKKKKKPQERSSSAEHPS